MLLHHQSKNNSNSQVVKTKLNLKNQDSLFGSQLNNKNFPRETVPQTDSPEQYKKTLQINLMIKLSKKLKVYWATVSIVQLNQDALILTFVP